MFRESDGVETQMGIYRKVLKSRKGASKGRRRGQQLQLNGSEKKIKNVKLFYMSIGIERSARVFEG